MMDPLYFTEREQKLMEPCLKEQSKEPRENLIKLIGHIEPKVEEFGVNSPMYYVLDRALNDEQVDLANYLKLRKPMYLDTLAKKSGKSIQETTRIVGELCKIGVTEYNPDKHGVDRVELSLFVVGILEQTLMDWDVNNAETNPERAVAFKRHTNYMMDSAGHFLPVANFGVHRPIPIESALKNEKNVETWENLHQIIEESAEDSYAICECVCRRTMKAYGEVGGEPDFDWCMPVGKYADYLVRVGKAKRVTKEEFLARLQEADDRGFVHNASNHDGYKHIDYICNCDYETCMSLRSSLYSGAANFQKSNFVAEVNPKNCVACGSCVEKCPQNAVKLGRKLLMRNKPDYVKAELPNESNTMTWGPEHYDVDYRLHRKDVRPETGTSPCKSNCPAHVAVQGYLKMAAQGRYLDALELIKKENPLPAVCGNICNRRCEQVCTRGDIDKAVAIDDVKKFIAYREMDEDKRFVPKKFRDHGKKVAVIGGGPAGISAAYYLAVEGHDVTVFDKNEELGGMLRYGVPTFRLEKDVIAAEISVLKDLGVTFKCGVEVGEDVTLADLRAEGYKGFFIAIGAQGGRKIGVPGEDAEGVVSGVDFLRKFNAGEDICLGKKTVVVGGGNVAIDVARSAVRTGCEEISLFCLESADEMPAAKDEQDEAREESISINNGWGPKEILVKDGKVTAVVFKKCLRVKDETGRFNPQYDEEDLLTVETDSVLLSVGQAIQHGKLFEGTKVELNRNGTVVADPFTYQTAEPDIFVGGDLYTGPRFAIDAIAAGKQGAQSLHRFAWDNHISLGRNRREYQLIDKEDMIFGSYDTAPRQVPAIDPSKKKTIHDERGLLTEEQVKIETSRCLGCGAAFVDKNMCIGCGVCTTRCKKDAITLHKEYNVKPVPHEQFMMSVGKEVARRAFINYKDNPVKLATETAKVLSMVLPDPFHKNKPWKW